MKPILDMFPEKSFWPMAALGVVITAIETGILPTPQANAMHEIDKRLISVEFRVAQANDNDGELDKKIENLGDQVDDNTDVLHNVEVNQGRLDQKLDGLKDSISRDLQRLFNRIDRDSSSRRTPHRVEDVP